MATDGSAGGGYEMRLSDWYLKLSEKLEFSACAMLTSTVQVINRHDLNALRPTLRPIEDPQHWNGKSRVGLSGAFIL